jgi:hypothetical protein
MDEENAWQCVGELARIILGSSALEKACLDDCFDYALKLRTGEVIRFTGAKVISPGWIHLEVMPKQCQPAKNGLPFMADRGVDVRIADIVWVMDAPEGS